ncbi:MAG: endonuclease domain-containing protein [Actinomycetota bacterium]|nr:endonuclease domain-containing protein [Actinomycetota bacterium]
MTSTPVTEVAQVLERMGGVASWGELRRTVPARRLRRAVSDGSVVRGRRGRYALVSLDDARATADRLTAVVSHLTAAGHWGWSLKLTPTRPHVTVRRKRRLGPAQRAGVTAHYRDLEATDVIDGWVTSPVRTVIDCCLDLPWDEALAVFDSAWRNGLKPVEVQVAARHLPTRQRERVWAVAAAADMRAANPFESVLRAIVSTVPGLAPEPQRPITARTRRGGTVTYIVDLADEALGIVLEADSFEFHGNRKALDRDCRRYDRLVVEGWLVLRFSYEMVMSEPAAVWHLVKEAVALRMQGGRLSRRAGRSPVCACQTGTK